jgi:hypothetical protein
MGSGTVANPVNDPSSKHYVPTERRMELVNEDVTLDGKRAKILGWSQDFATITQLPDGKVSAEFAWATVERVIKHSDGAFKA